MDQITFYLVCEPVVLKSPPLYLVQLLSYRGTALKVNSWYVTKTLLDLRFLFDKLITALYWVLCLFLLALRSRNCERSEWATECCNPNGAKPAAVEASFKAICPSKCSSFRSKCTPLEDMVLCWSVWLGLISNSTFGTFIWIFNSCDRVIVGYLTLKNIIN